MIIAGDESDAPLREQLRSTIDHLAQQPEARKLCLALALAEGFQFQIVVCNTTRLATALQLWLEEAVAIERETPVIVERLSPYPLDWRAAGPSELGEAELGEMVLKRLVGEGGSVGRMVFIDAVRATARDADAWRALMRRLNERRNSIARDLAGSLTLILPPTLDVDFARLAPDLWSIRSVAVELREHDEPARLLRSFEVAFRTLEDASTLEYEVEQLRPRVLAGSEAAARSLQVLLLRLAGTKQRNGEIDEAVQLIDEATMLAEQVGDRGAQAACRLARSDLLVLRGDHDHALELIDEALSILREHGDEWTFANAWSRRADILRARGELEEALRIRREEELPVYERLGDIRERAVTLGRVADILQARGELEEALRIRKEEELPVYERLGDVRSRAVTLGKVADILQARGELEEALRIRREEELPVYERFGDVRSRALTLGQVADILEARGEFDEALRIRREEELPVYERLGDVRSLLVGQVALGINLLRRRRLAEDTPEIVALLAAALRNARRLRLPEAGQIADIVRQMGIDPDTSPFV